jgi:hypothetical protein
MLRDQRGMTFVEVLVAMLLTTFVLFACLSFTTTGFRSSDHNRDKQFATQKAISMIEEMKAVVQTQGNSAWMLDAFDDGNAYKTVLTADPSITDPAASISGNLRDTSGSWKYTRQITVSLLPGSVDDSVRMVHVKVCRNQDTNGDGKPEILGEVAGVLRTVGGLSPPTQTYDVYALAIENVPGWWVHMRTLIPFVQNTVQDLQSRNPGLEFRVHWITKLSYGRDPQYRPYINDTVDSTQAINWVYFYPGLMPTGSAIDYYYPTDNFKGHVLVDSTDTNGYDATNNPCPYSLADNFNNAMRYPDELALFNQRVAAGLETDDAPTLRILLERMYQNPFAYRNAIIINLHGEMMPFPPIRNYSDAAKEPVGYPNIRAVTHAEYLRYADTASSIKLRVYSYRTDPAGTPATNADWLGQNVVGSTPAITVTLKGISWTPTSGSGDIVAIQGGTDQVAPLGTADPYQAVNATTTPSTTGMYYSVTSSVGDTVISLYNSPLKTPQVLVSGSNYAGLNSNERLYGMEYIPAPMENLTVSSSPPTPFSINLATTHTISSGACNGGQCDKNTARWIITIPSSVLPAGSTGDEMITVETRIDSTTSGTRTDEPTNLSRTYVWKGDDTWIFGDGTSTNLPHLPITETYQILGDPRHLPYADLKSPHQGSGLALQNRLGMGYNRYFDDFQNSSGGNKGTTPGSNWQGWYYTVSSTQYGIKNDGTVGNDGWTTSGSSLEIDVHRIYQTLRTILVKTRTVFTTMTGWSFYYVGLGDEIGYDLNSGFTNSIPISNKPFDGTTGNTHEQSIIQGDACTSGAGFGCGVKYVRSNASGTYWWSQSWLGELYPDSAYSGASGWETVGNLATGSASTNFKRTLRSYIGVNLPTGTTFLDAGRMPEPEGSPSFYWCGTASSTFHHASPDGTGDLQTAGTEVSSNYNYPLSNDISINRPFNYNINNTGDNPNHFLQAPYGSALTAARRAFYYDHSVNTSDNGSALLTFSDSSNNAMFVAINGISMVGTSGSSFIAAYSMLTLIHSFIAGGKYNSGGTGHIEQLPRVVITSPDYTSNLVDPGSITVSWSRSWLRWDAQNYSSEYATGFSESSALSYTAMYSSDNGNTWQYMQDNSAATPGQRPSSSSLVISSGGSTVSYTWSTPSSSFPQGTYLIRVECYRDAIPLHYSYHQYRAFIRRTT